MTTAGAAVVGALDTVARRGTAAVELACADRDEALRTVINTGTVIQILPVHASHARRAVVVAVAAVVRELRAGCRQAPKPVDAVATVA